MRRRLPLLSCPLSLLALSAVLGGCSSSGTQQSISTSSIAPPRPETGMVTAPPQPRTADAAGAYANPGYAPPAYTPRPYGQQQPAYAAPAPYAQQPPPQRYVPREYAQGPYGQPNAYPPQQPPAYPAAPPAQPSYQQTGALPQQQAYGTPPPYQPAAPAAAAVAPLTTGSIGRQSNVIQVREGDTLFGISRRTGVPVQDIVAANKLRNGRIEVGQNLTIPQRAYR